MDYIEVSYSRRGLIETKYIPLALFTESISKMFVEDEKKMGGPILIGYNDGTVLNGLWWNIMR